MSFTIYGYEANPRTRLARITGAAQGIDLEISEVVPRRELNVDTLKAKFPRSCGKIPALEGPDIQLTEVIAICMYLAKKKPGTLLGDGSLKQEVKVLSWMSWANEELIMTLSKWFLPLIPGFTRPPPYDHGAIEAGKVASLAMLDTLESLLAGRTHLVGDAMTLADIFIGVMLSRGLAWVLDARWRAGHPNCMRHFDMVARWEPVRKIVPEFKLVETEPPNVNPYA